MAGFNMTIGSTTKKLKFGNGDHSGKNRIDFNNISLDCYSNHKFQNDSLFVETVDYIVVLKGVVLNKTTLMGSSGSWLDTIIKLYREEGNIFFKKFRGSFCGALYNKKKDECLVFVDHIASKQLYYYEGKNVCFLSSEISQIYSFLKDHDLSYQLNVRSVYNLLSYGYMLNNETLCDNIRKVMPGTYLLINNGKIEHFDYYRLPKSKLEGKIDEVEVIEMLDSKFRDSIGLQFEKDKEYNYKHLVSLSGGLDSRMTSWVAHKMGYVNQLNFTFSQSDYLDEKIAKKIAADLKHEWIFKALDNGNFLKDIDEINVISGGNALYYGLAHGNSLLKYINFEKLGMVHSGQLGDVIIGSYIKRLSPNDLKTLGGKFSKGIGNNVKDESFSSYEDLELAMIYQRGFNGINEGLKIPQIFTETMSPFYNIDFMEYCLSIPIKNRMNHSVYLKWIRSKYPDAANYIWEKTNAKPNRDPLTVTYKGRPIQLEKFPRLLLQKLGLRSPARSTKNHMNPIEYWYATNDEIRNFQDTYFKENIERINDEGLKADCQSLYTKGNAIEKNQVLTILSAIKLNF